MSLIKCRTGKCRSNTEIEEKTDCELDKDAGQANRIYEFTTIPSFVAAITFSLNEPVYIIKVTEKRPSYADDV